MPESRVLSISAFKEASSADDGSADSLSGTALLSQPKGLCSVSFKQCVIATGCLERSIWSLPIAGTRPEGVYTAGEAQELIELGGYDIGDNIFILGSGDIGQIMARRFRQLGKKVIAIAEISDHLGGMKRNQEQCIKAYDIPVMLQTTVIEIHGYPRVEGVTVHHFDSNTDEYIECETLISALGLIPDKSLADSFSERPDWLHFCGNADFVHDKADSASAQGEKLGKALATACCREASCHSEPS
jgi:NADPH-dependent 2,4-dienoyl-CoA reductase/sulfur reductase-like enzyme